LIAGFVLLVAMLGAIGLTSQKNHQFNLFKKQHVHSQLTRDLYAAVFLIKKAK
jgi:Tfp pilus assembly protein PilV